MDLTKFLLIILLLFIIPVSAAADSDVDDATIYVSSTGLDTGDGSFENPYNSISQAVEKYDESVNSNIYIRNGTYEFSQQISIEKDITFNGESKTGVVLDGKGEYSIFKVNSYNVAFSGLTFINGYSEDGGTWDKYASAIHIVYARKVVVDNCLFKNNQMGAISNDGGGSENVPLYIEVKNSQFINNTKDVSSYYEGGSAIYSGGIYTILNITNCTFKDNNASTSSGGAIDIANIRRNSTITNCSFINNTAANGAAIYMHNGYDMTITDCVFENNTAGEDSGAVEVLSSYNLRKLYVGGNTFNGNVPETDYCVSETIEIVSLDGNDRLTAADIVMDNGDDVYFNVILKDSNGRGIENKEITITLTDYFKKVYTYTNTTNSSGVAIFSLKNQNPGTYNVASVFEGDDDWDYVATTNIVKIKADHSFNIVFNENPIKISAGDSYIVTGTVCDEYLTPDYGFSEYAVSWISHAGSESGIVGHTISGYNFTFDVADCGLTTQFEPYYINFTATHPVGFTAKGTLIVDVSVPMPPVPEDIETIYVSNSGSDETGDGTEDNPLATIQMALYVNEQFGGGKTIIVDEGTYDMANVNIYADVNIIGIKSKTVFRQNQADRGFFDLSHRITANFTNITFINGYRAPYSVYDAVFLIRSAGSVANFKACEFYNNSGSSYGVMCVEFGGEVSVTDCVFENNSAYSFNAGGGAILVLQSTLNVINSTFIRNNATDGGAIHVSLSSNVLIANSTFINNTAINDTNAYGGGGAIYINDDGVHIYNCTFIGNYAVLNGGAIYVNAGSALIEKSFFENNRVKSGSSTGTAIASDSGFTIDLYVYGSIFLTDDGSRSVFIANDYAEQSMVILDSNYWGSNSKPVVNNAIIEDWAIIQATMSENSVYVGETVEITIEFKDAFSYSIIEDLLYTIHDFKLDLSTDLGEINTTSIVIADNIAKITYTATENGVENITMNYNGVRYVYSFNVGESDVERKNITPIITVTPGVNTIIDVELPDNATGDLIITVDKTDYTVAIANNHVILNASVKPGTHNVVVYYYGNDYYRGFTNTTSFYVEKINATMNIDSLTTITVGDTLTVNVTLTPEDVTGEVRLEINGSNYTATLENGSSIVTIKNLAYGNYTINVYYLGDSTYNTLTGNATVSVLKITDWNIGIISQESKTGEITLSITSPADIQELLVKFKNTNHTVSMADGKGSIVLSNLEPGNYSALIVYAGDNKYDTKSLNTSFTISKIKDYEFSLTANESTPKTIIISVDVAEDINGSVIFNVLNQNYTVLINNSKAILKLDDIAPGDYAVNAAYPGDSKYESVLKTITVNVCDEPIHVNVTDVVKYFGGSERFMVSVTDSNNNPVANQSVVIIVNGLRYDRFTNINGKASAPLQLNSGVYNVTTICGNITFNSTVTIKATVNGSDLIKVYRNASQYIAHFIDGEGNVAANTTVSFNINGVFYNRTTNKDGIARLNINLIQGEYVITAINLLTGESHANTITVLSRIINTTDVEMYYRNGTQYIVTLVDDNGNPVSKGVEVSFNINGMIYKRLTNDMGMARLNLNLQPGDYIITAEYMGCRVSNNITILSVISANDLNMSYRDGSRFEAKLLNGNGLAYSGVNITFNINGIFYDRTTDVDGIARLNINLMSGQYIITSSYQGTNVANTITIS